MRAAYYTGNQKFSLENISPVEVGEDDVSISVAYCGICGTDMHVYHGAMDTLSVIPRFEHHQICFLSKLITFSP